MILSVVANAICVYIEKLGLQSINTVSYSSLTLSKKSFNQSTTQIHVSMLGILLFAKLLTALDCSSRSGSPHTKSMFWAIPSLYLLGVVINSCALKEGGIYG